MPKPVTAARIAALLLLASSAIAPQLAAAQDDPATAQDEVAAVDPTLGLDALEAESMALIEGFAAAIDSGLPSPRAALDAATRYVTDQAGDAERIGAELKRVKQAATPEQRAAWVERSRTRFASELEHWRKTLVRFETVASDAEIVELNGLVKRLTSPMRLP